MTLLFLSVSGLHAAAAAAAVLPAAEDGERSVVATEKVTSVPVSPTRGSSDEDDDGGFEKVDAWMAQGFGEGGGSGNAGGSGASSRERRDSLLVPFPGS